MLDFTQPFSSAKEFDQNIPPRRDEMESWINPGPDALGVGASEDDVCFAVECIEFDIP